MSKRYCDIKEISEYTSLPVKTLYDWAGQGKMPSIKIGKRVLFDIADIDKFMTSLKRTNHSDAIVKKIIGDIKDNGL